MIIEKSNELMKKAFSGVTYRYEQVPDYKIKGEFGIYIHVPFCYSKCNFCPFYKEIFNEKQKNRYVKALSNEIECKDIKGNAKWMYIGGGTPNTLSLKDLSDIITKVKEKVETQSLGIELLPSILTNEYLKGLVEIGFNKISLGIESMAKEVISNTQRLIAEDNKIIKLISESKKLKLFVNIDLMVGLANQTAESFLNDVKNLSIEKPSQITIYPYMMIGSNSNSSKMKESEQFQLIEKAWTILKAIGYKRSGIWTFTIEDDIYDSSRDELIEDYIGFGPAAFSTYDNYKVVNPELSVYLKNHNENKHYALISIKDKNTDIWRHFSRMLYDLEINNNIKLPFYMKTYLLILRICGFIKKNKLTNKGIMLSHNLTKTVVENLPYPLQNKHIIENNRDYLKALE